MPPKVLPIGDRFAAALVASLWLGGVMLLYALQFSSHAFYIVTERASDRLHAIINNLDFTGVVVCLVSGTIVAWRRRNQTKAAS